MIGRAHKDNTSAFFLLAMLLALQQIMVAAQTSTSSAAPSPLTTISPTTTLIPSPASNTSTSSFNLSAFIPSLTAALIAAVVAVSLRYIPWRYSMIQKRSEINYALKNNRLLKALSDNLGLNYDRYISYREGQGKIFADFVKEILKDFYSSTYNKPLLELGGNKDFVDRYIPVIAQVIRREFKNAGR